MLTWKVGGGGGGTEGFLSPWPISRRFKINKKYVAKCLSTCNIK